MGAASLAVAVSVWISLAGDARTALEAVEHSTRSAAGEWARQYCSGPWYQFPYLLWMVGPLTAAAALAGAGIALSLGWAKFPDHFAIADHRAAGLAAFVTLGFVSFASFVPHLQYLRIMSPAAGSYCLLAGVGLWFLLSMVLRSIGSMGKPAQYAAALAVGTGILAAGIHDYRSFTNVVVRSGMEELSVFGIRLLMNR